MVITSEAHNGRWVIRPLSSAIHATLRQQANNGHRDQPAGPHRHTARRPAALREEWPIRSRALFGSRVRDDARPDSDLDVLVAFARPIPLLSFLALQDRLSELTGLNVNRVSAPALKRFVGIFRAV